jgi:hypothetical protein
MHGILAGEAFGQDQPFHDRGQLVAAIAAYERKGRPKVETARIIPAIRNCGYFIFDSL